MLGVRIPPGLPVSEKSATRVDEAKETMSKASESIQGIRTFFGEVGAELKKCAWPTRPELFDSTLVVIISVALLGGFVAVCDVVLRWLVHVVIG